MSNITTQMLEKLISNSKKYSNSHLNTLTTTRSEVINSLIGFPQETTSEIEKLKKALIALSPDTGYGSGSFYDSNGNPQVDYWLACIWAIASLDWSCGKGIAQEWSQKSERYTELGFEKAWGSYNPKHKNPITISSLYKFAGGISPTQSEIHESQRTKNKFNLLSAAELASIANTEWIIKGVLPELGLAAIYGPSGSGKTFLALDLIMAITSQSKWFDFKVKNKPVVYVGLEGKAGLKNRIAAWEKVHGTTAPSNLKIIIDNLSLKTESEVIALANQIVSDNMSNGVVVIDTLNQASPGSDENSSVDMGLNIKNLQLLQALTNGLVIIIHHTGKDPKQGLRGHSSLKGALDASIQVAGNDKRSWLLDKSKDGEDGLRRGFKLDVINLGVDSDNDPITSCRILPDFQVLLERKEPRGAAQKAALKAIKEKLKLNPKLTIDEAIEAIKPILTTVKANQRSNRARSLIQSLVNGDHLQSTIENDEGVIWLD